MYVNDEGELTDKEIESKIVPGVKIVGITQISNVLGTINDVKKIVKRFTKVYDPKKTKEGTLINENQVTIPGADDDVFKGRYRVLQRMNRLSNILLSKKNLNKSPNIEEIMNKSIESQKKTFDRHTLNRNTLKKKDNSNPFIHHLKIANETQIKKSIIIFLKSSWIILSGFTKASNI